VWLFDLAGALDGQPGGRGPELRAILRGGRLEAEQAAGAASAVVLPWAAAGVAPGEDRNRLRRMAAEVDAGREPVLRLLTLARALELAGDEARAERLLRSALVARPQEVVLHFALAGLLTGQQPPRWGEAVECLQAARALRPGQGVILAHAWAQVGRAEDGLALLRQLASQNRDSAWVQTALGFALFRQQRTEEAIRQYRKAIEINPRYAEPHNLLGGALHAKGELDEAIREYRKAIAINPRFYQAHYNLGSSLHAKGEPGEAIKEYRKAIDINPRSARAHYNLGNALHDMGKLGEAIKEYRKAIEIDPRHVSARCNLGLALHDVGKAEEAMKEYRKAIEIDPRLAEAHTNLGNALRGKEKLDEAIKEYRKAIAINPRLAEARHNLGLALHAKGELDEAIREYRRAIAINPRYAGAHHNLGLALHGKGEPDEAIKAYRQAVDINPKFGEAHARLGVTLLQVGQLVEARQALQKAKQHLPPRHPGRPFLAKKEEECGRLLALDETLPAILKGDAKPKDAAQRLDLAALCRSRQLHASSARYCAEAFAEQPNLAGDLRSGRRYLAACSAALAGVGKAKDAAELGEEERARLRRQALEWLRADLAHWATLPRKGAPQARQEVRRALTRWRQDPDLGGLRDKGELVKLPEGERQACRDLWADVDALLRRLGEAP
jgi:superkiller protein 3